MEDLLKGLRAGAESTRLRLLFILAHGEFNVTELTAILAQSQPRVSRHLKLMCEAGLVDRHKEGSWVLFRLSETGAGAAVARLIIDLLPANDALLQAVLSSKRVRAQRGLSVLRESAKGDARNRRLPA